MVQNYMDYSDDLCKNNFTPEQILRMRYALVHYRPLLYSIDTDCPGDINGDGIVNAADLGIVIGTWGTPDGQGDVNGDGIVNAADLGLVIGLWGNCP